MEILTILVIKSYVEIFRTESRLPKDLEHPGKVRNLLEALYETGTWTEEDLEKLTSKNIRRVFAKVEEVCKNYKICQTI